MSPRKKKASPCESMLQRHLVVMITDAATRPIWAMAPSGVPKKQRLCFLPFPRFRLPRKLSHPGPSSSWNLVMMFQVRTLVAKVLKTDACATTVAQYFVSERALQFREVCGEDADGISAVVVYSNRFPTLGDRSRSSRYGRGSGYQLLPQTSLQCPLESPKKRSIHAPRSPTFGGR